MNNNNNCGNYIIIILIFDYYRILVIAAFSGGVLLGNESNLLLICSYQWLIMGGIGYLLFVYCNTSTAALGLLLISLHIMSLLPQLYSRLTDYNPSTVLPVAIVVYLCLLFISRVDVGGVKLSTFVVLVGVVFQWYGLRKWLPLGQELGTCSIIVFIIILVAGCHIQPTSVFNIRGV